jgi:hypothetical protein
MLIPADAEHVDCVHVEALINGQLHSGLCP